MKNQNVNLFFSCDDKYSAFMAVALKSIKNNSAKDRVYNTRILHTGMAEDRQNKIISSLSDKNFNIEFIDISDSVSEFGERLHTRDYYSKTTYYRLFIPNLFPELDKALYLDSDIVVTGDIAELYDVEMGECLVGAVRDEFVYSNEILRSYVENRVGHKSSEHYFNAGVLLMNLKEMRRVRFEEMFLRLLEEVKFDVAQDQDYLNVICKDKVVYMDSSWNFMPLPYATKPEIVNLIHFNLDNKPWQKNGILFDELFWTLADESIFSREITERKNSYSSEDVARSAEETAVLIENAKRQAEDEKENNSIKEKIARVISEFYK